MNDSYKRQSTIRMLLTHMEVSSQHMLLGLLKQRGFEVSQPTLSKDLTQMHVAKVHTNGKQRYVLPENPLYQREVSRNNVPPACADAYISCERSGNMAVIHTKPGYATAVATEIDRAKFASVLGTVAGYDTIMLLLRENTLPEAFNEELSTLFVTDGKDNWQ